MVAALPVHGGDARVLGKSRKKLAGAFGNAPHLGIGKPRQAQSLFVHLRLADAPQLPFAISLDADGRQHGQEHQHEKACQQGHSLAPKVGSECAGMRVSRALFSRAMTRATEPRNHRVNDRKGEAKDSPTRPPLRGCGCPCYWSVRRQGMTWSIIARDAETGAFGVAVTTKFFAVGALCPHAGSGIGALATQALVNPTFGPQGLRLLAEGKPAAAVADTLIAGDAGREARQLHVIDAQGGI